MPKEDYFTCSDDISRRLRESIVWFINDDGEKDIGYVVNTDRHSAYISTLGYEESHSDPQKVSANKRVLLETPQIGCFNFGSCGYVGYRQLHSYSIGLKRNNVFVYDYGAGSLNFTYDVFTQELYRNLKGEYPSFEECVKTVYTKKRSLAFSEDYILWKDKIMLHTDVVGLFSKDRVTLTTKVPSSIQTELATLTGAEIVPFTPKDKVIYDGTYDF